MTSELVKTILPTKMDILYLDKLENFEKRIQ